MLLLLLRYRRGTAAARRAPSRTARGKHLRPGGRARLESTFFMMEFHISREARERYEFSDTLFSFNGNVVFADMPACRRFAHKMNQVRDAENNPDRAVHAGALFAMGLIDE